jgi:DegV family protein with EDD domain
MKNTLSPQKIVTACVAGFENVTAWSDLLDRINVFPVADGDTGTNLRLSLAPLRECEAGLAAAVSRLARSGRGNSGNIAVAFFREFLDPDGSDLATQAQNGRDRAWQAIANPCSGTMLGLFDALCEVLAEEQEGDLEYMRIRKRLQQAVLATESQLPSLEAAEVVDSGALGMFIFFDGFFQELTGKRQEASPIVELFGEKLYVSSSFHPQATGEYCVEAVLATEGAQSDLSGRISSLGSSGVVVPDESGVKLHLHTRDPQQLRKELASLGRVVNWSDEAMDPMIHIGENEKFLKNSIRIMSDAAGSIPLTLARAHGITLLDSYIVTRDQAQPESLSSSEQLYSLMKDGVKVSTAQASSHERHLHYQAACKQYGKVLYLSAGSAFTGNYATAVNWKKEHDCNDRFTVMDSGAASGRLAVMALCAARLAEQGAAAAEVIAHAQELSSQAEEYVFINELKYLVAGGRVSRTKGFFADLLHMKPVISPGFEGVRKLGVVRNRDAQLEFALAKLGELGHDGSGLLVLLQYTDNKEWLSEVVREQVRNQVPAAEVLLVPLSLTSGVHMGPGTWSMAFAATKDSQC